MSQLAEVALERPVVVQPRPIIRRTSAPRAEGKFLYVGERKLYLRGVTYGTFRPNEDCEDFPERDVVRRDFMQMTAAGINAVRTYTAPPRWLLDAAAAQGLFVLVGLAWPQHVAFLDDRSMVADIERSVRRSVRRVRGHEAVLGYAIGNEIPAPIVRWHRKDRVEGFLRHLRSAVKEEHPEGLVTYVNYPTTEYLDLSFLDFCSFNVYLESRDRLCSYVARLQNLVGEKPLVMAEIGLDSRRHGPEKQADTLDWQVRTAFEGGCAGTFVFSWTDEWHRGGYDIEDWDFGVTTRGRSPKVALSAVERAYAAAPLELEETPRISVVVCTYNGSATIRETLTRLERLEYPDYEVVVVNDGSTDATASLVEEFDVRLISTGNRGLGHARNVGLRAATGEIVAYIDDDAFPDPHWLDYLAHAFEQTGHVGIGGPNIVPPDDGEIAQCVASAPGGPCHVLLSDEVAEHIPGCNMAFRTRGLRAVGGFDRRFRVAGDDVDICWKLQDRGWTLGFHPGAVVWHRRRPSVRKYLKQQMGYGKAEALLERKWPHRFNTFGHVPWDGRIYGRGLTRGLFSATRIYQGTWGTASFQSLVPSAPGRLGSLPLMPEWLLLVAGLGLLALLGENWPVLGWVALPFALTLGATIAQAVRSGLASDYAREQPSRRRRWRVAGRIAALHVAQPVVRLIGRQRYGLTPWRRGGAAGWRWPRRMGATIWSEGWRSAAEWLEALERNLRRVEARVFRGGACDRWDLRVRGALFGDLRLLMTVEEHGGGKQNVRFRTWPRLHRVAIVVAPTLGLALWAAIDGALLAAASVGVCGLAVGVAALADAGATQARLERALRELERGSSP